MIIYHQKETAEGPNVSVSPVFRFAQLTDAEAILTIYNLSMVTGQATGHLKPITLITVIDWLEAARTQRPFWVASHQGEVIAWFALEDFYGLPAFESAVEVSLYVAEHCQRQGVGAAVLAFLETEAYALGISHLLAFIYAHNHASLSLFQQVGYQQWGCLPKIALLQEQRQDLMLLGKVLPP